MNFEEWAYYYFGYSRKEILELNDYKLKMLEDDWRKYRKERRLD